MLPGLFFCCARYPIHYTGDRPPLLADGLPAKGENEYPDPRQKLPTQLIPATEVRICLYLYTDGAVQLAEACQGRRPCIIEHASGRLSPCCSLTWRSSNGSAPSGC